MADDAKARLYRKLVREAPDAAVVERMRVNGFWPASQGLPADPPAEARERAAVDEELRRLRASSPGAVDPDKALAAERKRRWAESLKRRKAKREARAAALKTKRAAWLKHFKSHVVHLGRGVSAGLQDTSLDADALTSRGLPVMASSADLAMMMGVPLARVKWLTYHRRSAALVHYHRFGIPKKTGGTRAISAPKPALKRAQAWVLKNVLAKLEVSREAHGFVAKRSIVTNASPHVGRAVVVNLDLKDFFPSITFGRVKGLFRKLGYNEHVATVLALLCTEPPRAQVELDGRAWFVSLGQRVLPQGACTSPAITNALCWRLDRRLAGLAAKRGWSYTRYADDITLSGDDNAAGRLLRSVRSILETEGFTEQATKTRVMRRARRQEVTGVVVNQRVSLPRDEYKALRATLHNAARHGLASQNRDDRPNFAGYLKGRVAYAKMVDPARGARLESLLAAALAKP